MIRAASLVLLASIALPGMVNGVDARVRRHSHHRQHFVEQTAGDLPPAPSGADGVALTVGAFSVLFTQGIGTATSALPNPAYPTSYGF